MICFPQWCRLSKRALLLSALVLISSGSLARADLSVSDNVLIDFGEKLLVEDNWGIHNDQYATEKYYPETGWNLQAGKEKDLNCYTTTLTDKVTGEASDIQVMFAKMKGLNLLGGYSPIQGHASVLTPEKPMQSVWEIMHDATLTEKEVNSYWCEEVTIGVAASIGDITVSNLKADSTYAVSAVVTVAEVVSLIGKAAPVTLNYGTGATQKAAFMTTNSGSVNIEVALGNFDVASLISGKTFSMTWIFETAAAPTSVDLEFASSLVSVVGVTSISAMAVTRYDDSVASVQAMFEEGANMLHPVAEGVPEPSMAAMSLLALAGLAARRRRRRR